MKLQAQNKKRQRQPSKIKIPKIPRAFVEHPKVKYVFCDVINDFNYEEKVAIYFYCFEKLLISEIANLTNLSQNHVASALNLYSERLASKVCFFKKTVPYNANDQLSVNEILFPEYEMT